MIFFSKTLTIFIILTSFIGCYEQGSKKYLPKGYYRIEFPIKKYEKTHFDFKNTDFYFDLPKYLDFSLDTIEKKITLTNTEHEIKIYLSYKKIQNDLDDLIEECYNIVTDPILFNQSYGITAIPDPYFAVYEISGPVATPTQFYVTDRKNHFLRGVMYTSTQNNNKINSDSLKPIIDFFQEDIYRIINTIKWSDFATQKQ